MPEVKKLLVAYNPAKPDSRSSDFLIPWCEADVPAFRGLKSGKTRALGLMVYIGRGITENDLFAKLVDSGAFIPDVDRALEMLGDYLRQIQGMKIGDQVEVVPSSESQYGFRLQIRK